MVKVTIKFKSNETFIVGCDSISEVYLDVLLGNEEELKVIKFTGTDTILCTRPSSIELILIHDFDEENDYYATGRGWLKGV